MKKVIVKKWQGRDISQTIEFKEKGTFAAFYAARRWAKENGYSDGLMQADAPIGLVKGDCGIAKWRNLSDEDKTQLDGVMTSGDFREGEVTIYIF